MKIDQLLPDRSQQPRADRRVIHIIADARLPDHPPQLQRLRRIERNSGRNENRADRTGQPRRHGKSAAHHATVAPVADHSLVDPAAEQQLNRTHQDRFARPGFPGDDVETGPELQLGLLNQRKIRDFHIDKHAEKISPETLFFKPEAGRKDLKIPRTRLSFPPCRRNRPGTAGRSVCSVPNRSQEGSDCTQISAVRP